MDSDSDDRFNLREAKRRLKHPNPIPAGFVRSVTIWLSVLTVIALAALAVSVASMVTPINSPSPTVTPTPSPSPSPVDSQPGQSVSAVDYGADPSGATDSTEAIMAADLAASSWGRPVFFPPGTYVISPIGTTNMSRGGSDWVGASAKTSVIKASSGPWHVTGIGIVNAVDLSNFHTTNLTFDLTDATFAPGTGNPGNTYSPLRIQGCTNWVVRNCEFIGIQDHVIGLSVDAGSFGLMEGNYFSNAAPSGNYNQSINISNVAGQPTHMQVTNNVLDGSGLFATCSDSLISGNTVQNWIFGGGLTLGPDTNSSNIIVSGNMCLQGGSAPDINDKYSSGIECWLANVTISHNICLSNGDSGIRIGGANNVVIGNTCFNNGQHTNTAAGISAYGINGQAAIGCVVSSNSCFDNQTVKTQAFGYAEWNTGDTDVAYITLVDNNFQNNSTAPTQVVSTNLNLRAPNLFSQVSWNPGTVTAGQSIMHSFSVSDATNGDHVKVGLIGDYQQCVITGYVAAAGSIDVLIYNPTASSVTFGASTINLWVEKAAGYANY